MAFENDPEGRRLAQMYAGSDFDKPKIIQHELLCSYTDEWTFDEFQGLLADISKQIPDKYRHTARVYMYDPGYDGSTSFRIDYTGPESAEATADRIKRCEQYVTTSRADELREYERLKGKFAARQST